MSEPVKPNALGYVRHAVESLESATRALDHAHALTSSTYGGDRIRHVAHGLMDAKAALAQILALNS